jgi:hypothetical protein
MVLLPAQKTYPAYLNELFFFGLTRLCFKPAKTGKNIVELKFIRIDNITDLQNKTPLFSGALLHKHFVY